MSSPDVEQHKQRLFAVCRGNESKARSVEDAELQQRTRSLMQLDEWRKAARQAVELNALLQLDAASMPAADVLVVQAMLKWFKGSFFSWVDAPPCGFCGGATSLVGGGQPTPDEARHGAGRVEVYRCPLCEQLTRFPRFTDPGKLLETRRGRCGEWAHCFLLMLRAAGYDARHVSDDADHVWCEAFIESRGRWVHCDPCEAAFDTPLLYEGGWGKKPGHVLACSRHGHADVTKRYVLPTALPQLSSRRHGVPEQWLATLLAKLTRALRAGLPTEQRTTHAVRDAMELLQLMALETDEAAAAAAAAAAADLPGRESGSEAWRQARQETGAATGTSAAAGRPEQQQQQQVQEERGTAYAYAQDGSLPPLFSAACRVTGGVCRAAGEHAPAQTAQRLFDGSLGSKWLDFGAAGASGSTTASWVEYRLLPSAAPLVVSSYNMIAAEDCPERDPAAWTLEAAVEDDSSSSTWVVLDRRSGHAFEGRHALRSFSVPPETRVPSRRWRLRITALRDAAAANSVQLACWNLYSSCCGDADWQQQLASAAAAAPACANTLQRVLHNLVQQPQVQPKFFRLAAGRAAKLQELLADPVLAQALLRVGFRPVLQPEEASNGNDGGGSSSSLMTLVADSSAQGAPAVIKAAREVLQQLGGDGVATV